MRNDMMVGMIAMVLAALPAAASSTALTGPRSQDLPLAGGGNGGQVGHFTLLTDAGGSLAGVLNYYDVYDASWKIVGHRVDLHAPDGSFVRTVASDDDGGYAAFVNVRGGDVLLGYAGVGDPSHDVLREVVGGLAATNGSVAKVMDLPSGFAMTFSPGGEAYAVYNDGTNRIGRLDFDAGIVELVVNVGGYSAGLAFSAAGDLLFGTYQADPAGGPDRIARLTVAQLAAMGPLPLTLADAATVAELPAGCGVAEVAVDEAGNVVFGMNGALGGLCMVEAGKDYTALPEGFDVLSRSAPGAWLRHVETIGDVRLYDGIAADNAAFVVGFGYPISYVPEPATAALVAAGAAAMSAVRRRRGRSRRRAG